MKKMGDLQCTVEFCIELQKFINVDLFQRGYYQIRTSLRSSPKLPAKIEVTLPRNSSCSLTFPACIVNGAAVSKTFQILYKNEEIQLEDIIAFKAHFLIDSHRVREILHKADFQLMVELWFTDQNFGPDQHNSIQCVSTRILHLHFDPSRGLHHHIPVFFDYFHLCAVTITIHSTVLALCQPYLSLQRSSRQSLGGGSPRLSNKKPHRSSLETVLFGNQGCTPQVGRIMPSTGRLNRARLIHWELCSLLLSAYTSLQKRLSEYLKLLPPWQQIKIESLDCSDHLENLSEFAKHCHKHLKTTNSLPPSKDYMMAPPQGANTEEDFLILANSDIALLCGALIVLWQKFLQFVVGQEKVRHHLARQRHVQRVKRFAEAFFVIERTRESAFTPCENSTDFYQRVTEAARRSQYLTLLPPLEVECIDLDGDHNSLPIIYEERYEEITRRTSRNSRGSQSTISLCDVSFLVEESPDEETDSERRNSQGLDIQKTKLSDNPKLSTSPTVLSWISESASMNTKFQSASTRKISLKEKFLNNFKVDFDSDSEEYNVATGTLRTNHKLAMCSKIKLKSRTANFLRQLKKPHSNFNNSVVLLGFKKLDSARNISAVMTKSSRSKIPLENGIRHSQSTLSMVGTLSNDNDRSLPNSESLPDLTTNFIPPPPPPPRARFASSELDWPSSDFILSDVPQSPAFDPPIRKNSRRRHSVSLLPRFRGTNNNSRTFSKEDSSIRHYSHTSDTSLIKSESLTKFLCENEQYSKDISDDVFNYNNAKNSDSVNHSYQNGSTELVDKVDEKSEQIIGKCAVNSKELERISSTVKSEEQTDFHIYEEICPPSPPVQFRDPPKNESVSKQDNKYSIFNMLPNTDSIVSNPTTCLSSLSCEGTLFFPKPPAQFAADSTNEEVSQDKEKPTECTNNSNLRNENEKDGSPCLKTSDSKQYSSDDFTNKQTKKIDEISYFETKCTILEMLTDISDIEDPYWSYQWNDATMLFSDNNQSHSGNSPLGFSEENTVSLRRASAIGADMISFVKAKEEFRQQLGYSWFWYSDLPSAASIVPYFQCDNDLRAFSPEGLHLVICVHGLDGNSADLRLVRTYLELGLPTVNFEFLMSERNQGETFDDFETMTDRLVSEITYHIEVYGLKPSKISFIGHSLGNIIIRSALARPEMKPYLNQLHTFLSLSGPHLGTLYNNSGLVNMGMWFMQKWKKSGSLLQLALKDTIDVRQSFLYRLSKQPGLEYFQNVLLFGSSQDRYVPLHSARIELCKAALKDTSPQGVAYREMVANLLQPIISKPDIVFLRYDVHHALPSSANSLIGRAAHIAVLDSELFIEKFMVVCGLKYFS
ncbi:protein FAM135A [Centruroides vittatus]|uniref:protein FAM135A n=1 Tax=Centruroides vittatus TaxID=120091 RepID=UPI00350FAC82